MVPKELLLQLRDRTASRGGSGEGYQTFFCTEGSKKCIPDFIKMSRVIVALNLAVGLPKKD